MSEEDIRKSFNNAEIVDFDEKRRERDEDELNESLAYERRNDFGNGQRLKKRFGEDMMFVIGMDWFIWSAGRWKQDEGAMLAQRNAHMVAELIHKEAATINMAKLAVSLTENALVSGDAAPAEAMKIRDGLKKWGVASGNQSRILAMLAAASPYLLAEPKDLNRNDFLFNVENGTLDLAAAGEEKTGFIRLRKHLRSDKMTAIADVAYDETASAPQWLHFINQVLPDRDVQNFVQRYFGYMLTGSIEEQCLCFFLGSGSNGKSTLIDVVAEIMGDYSKGLPIESLLHDDRKQGAAPSPDLARLPGARFVRSSEPEVGSRFSTRIIKEVTGGEDLTVRELNKSFFEFKPQFKIVISANNKPAIRGGDDGIWRRIYLVPFEVKFDKSELDSKLKDKLLQEKAGILNWLLDGYRSWRELGGLKPPVAITSATDEYRDDQDPVGVFIRECVREATGRNIQAKDLYKTYCLWCEQMDIKEISSNLFGKLAKERGLHVKKISVNFYVNVELTEAAPIEQDEAGSFDPADYGST